MISTIVILITAEFLPKVFFQIYSNRLFKFFSFPAFIFYYLFSPLTFVFNWISDSVLNKYFKTKKDELKMVFSKDELGDYINREIGSEKDEHLDSEIQIFQKALEFSEVRAREIMIPRAEIVSVDDNRSMGGLSVYSDSIHLNLTNPASLSELKRVNYSLGITYDNLTFKSENANENSNSSNVNYLAVAIPTKHFTFAFGVIPQTSVGYLLESKDETVVPNIIDRYRGEGGVNTAFWDDLDMKVIPEKMIPVDHVASVTVIHFIFSNRSRMVGN